MSDSNAEPQTCCFCLGTEDDIPPFGSLVDAHDFVAPCSTCTIQCHRKCLVEWFNSLSTDKLQVVNAESLADIADLTGPSAPEGVRRLNIHLADFLIQNFLSNLSWSYHIDSNPQQEPLPTLSPTVLEPPSEEPETSLILPADKSMAAFLIAPCPQCKQKIVFSMRKSSLLAFQSGVRTLISRIAIYGGVFLGITSAVTGVLSMGYVGLTTVGLKMMDSLVPGRLLVQMLTRKAPNGSAANGYNTLSQLLLGNVNNYAIENLETALVKGLIDPFKFSRIPVLPIVLYRLRSTSLLSCLFAKNRDSSFNNWVAEFMLDGYISSLGNHELARSIVNNFRDQLTAIIRNPELLRHGINLFKGVDLWKTSNMISMLIPARWLYDLFFRLTLNRAHFDVTLGIRPRVITDSLSPQEGDKLEILNNQIGTLKHTYKIADLTISKQIETEATPPSVRALGLNTTYRYLKHKIRMYQTLYKIKYPYNYIKYRIQMWIHKTGACMINDYSTSLLTNSANLKVLTTLLWPYFSSKLGHIIFKLIVKRFAGTVPDEKLLLLSNMIGMVGVVFIKDLTNLFLSYQKASQVSKMVILRRDAPGNEEAAADQRPGLFSWLLSNPQGSDVVGEVAEVVNLYLNMNLDSSWEDDITIPGGYPS